MHIKLPTAKKLAADILAYKAGKVSIAGSVQFLLSNRSELAGFVGVEHFATAEGEDRIHKHSGCDHHFLVVRAQLARELWSRQIFVGVSILDELLFNAVAHGTTSDPILEVLERVRSSGLHHPGLVIFPVHSLGMLGVGWIRATTDASVEYISPDFGVAVSPQTNSFDDTVAFLDRARKAFGVKKAVDKELMEHWLGSRSAHWLTSNPLLVVRTQSFPGSYYENQSLILSKLRASTAMISMLACLQPDAGDTSTGGLALLSSSQINNFQTLDLKHYIVLFSAPSRKRLAGDCVPIFVRTPALTEISDLGIELDPRFWKRRRASAVAIDEAVRVVHAGYLKHSMGHTGNSVRGRACRKLFEALVFFRRAFHRTDNQWAGIISMAIAFEMILTDSYAKGVTARIIRRSKLCLRGVHGARKYAAAVKELYEARGAVVHSGSTSAKVDLAIVRQAFVHTFVALARRVETLSPNSVSPMADLCGDTQ